jgi:hypothetical protein
MTGADFIAIVASPAGVMLAGQIATLFFVIAGVVFMVGWRRFAKRLMVVAVIVIVIPFVVAANHNEIRWLIEITPGWVLAPIFAFGAVIISCWVLWGVIALCFGPAIASTVTADLLAWSIKALIIAIVAPYRGLAGLLRRVAPRDSSE